ncbi:glycoside hydrolase family 3 N-terminal domain-containing protein [Leifsonia sp. fls2-241-R2A-40a]|uniref:glycoside hydrolase family 3 protein n=1 Tax=Leifsonia sp. fls2-241-R2A-40a TaxID=3040290 RepID=UPI00254C6C90|nr:glycoside hydrolase family 3 N-terminal domain-containing protein [Leifsonia sp. fls2-241-R2A-40a]
MTTASTSRAREIVEGMTLDERIGLLLHPMIMVGDNPDPDASAGFGGPTFRELIVDHGLRFFCLGRIPSPERTAAFLRELQGISRSNGSRLPAVFSTDPRHAFLQNDGAAHTAAGLSQWPENLGLGAIGDADLVRRYAETVRRDYRAMGIRMALHPQIDLATEPRWARQAQSFGSDPETTSRLVVAFLEGLQGPRLDGTSVAATVKHFPGGGPQLDGEDPHFPYGREQVYPAGRFDDHLAPFRAAIAAGAAAIMPYYGMPVGLVIDGEPVEPVGFSFNRRIITGLLRDELGFDGVVLTDFGLVTDIEVAGKPFPARAWGVEELSPLERLCRLFEAGVDQLGGESDTRLIREAVDSGRLDPGRLAESALRLVRLMVELELVDGDLGGEDAPGADRLPRPDDVALGREAQARAVTILTNRANGTTAAPFLPVRGDARVHLVGVAEAALPPGWRAADAEAADFAVVRVASPFEYRDHFFLESGMQQGSLEFGADEIDRVLALARRLPVVLVVTLNRPAILTPFAGEVAALVGEFGAADDVLLAVLAGRADAQGALPFDLPRDMASVAASAPDAPDDTPDPLFRAGHPRR